MALAWVLAQGADAVPIPGAKPGTKPGTKTVMRLEENAGALSVGLSDGDMSRPDAGFSARAVSGAR